MGESFLIPLNILFPVALVIIILITVLWYLYKKNKKYAKKIIDVKTKYLIYQKKIQELKDSRESPEKDLKKINKMARDFLEDYYKISKDNSYSEIQKKLKNVSIEKFAKIMINLKYSGEKITLQELKDLLNLFEKIIKEKEPKKFLELSKNI